MSIYTSVYNELKALIDNIYGYKQYAKAWDMLDREGIADIIQDGNTFWFEYQTYSTATDKELRLLKKYIIKHKNLNYLYDR